MNYMWLHDSPCSKQNYACKLYKNWFPLLQCELNKVHVNQPNCALLHILKPHNMKQTNATIIIQNVQRGKTLHQRFACKIQASQHWIHHGQILAIELVTWICQTKQNDATISNIKLSIVLTLLYSPIFICQDVKKGFQLGEWLWMLAHTTCHVSVKSVPQYTLHERKCIEGAFIIYCPQNHHNCYLFNFKVFKTWMLQ